MSVVFVIAPAVVASWPILCGAVAGAAAALGYKVLKSDEYLTDEMVDSSVEICLEGSEVVADAMKRDSEFSIGDGNVTATFRRAADGRCTVHVSGRNKSEEELRATGKKILGQVTQQYAYNKVISELKNQGFTVTGEEVSNDQSIRIRVCKYV